MNGEAILFLLALVVVATLLFVMIIMLSDLECDYVNPIDLCNKLNKLVSPEKAAFGALFLIFFLTFSWSAVILNTPLMVYNGYQIMKRKHLYDATEVFRMLPQHKRESFLKLAFYLISFFYYLYRMIAALISNSSA